MKKLLYLVHRIPYPPNKGDKISSFNLLKYLARSYQIFLGTFIDHPDDWQHTPKLHALCADTCFVGIRPTTARLSSLRGLLNDEALTLAYYRSATLQTWVNTVCAEQQLDAVLIYSSAMGQYVPDKLPVRARTLFDMEDVDSDKWRSYAETRGWPLSWLYARESRKLLAYERAMAAQFNVSVFISASEAALFRQLAPEVAERVTHRIQGVDSDFYRPDLNLPNPYPPNRRILVFCGAMDYWPNIDGVRWFVDQVLPAVIDSAPDTLFAIVGMNPSIEVRKLAQRPQVMVTGAVPDVRPYVLHAQAVVLPLRIARGIQNKALEAMALAKPIIATSSALNGIVRCPEFHPSVADTAEQMAAATLEVLQTGRDCDPGARACVEHHYDWEVNLGRMQRMLETGQAQCR